MEGSAPRPVRAAGAAALVALAAASGAALAGSDKAFDAATALAVKALDDKGGYEIRKPRLLYRASPVLVFRAGLQRVG